MSTTNISRLQAPAFLFSQPRSLRERSMLNTALLKLVLRNTKETSDRSIRGNAVKGLNGQHPHASLCLFFKVCPLLFILAGPCIIFNKRKINNCLQICCNTLPFGGAGVGGRFRRSRNTCPINRNGARLRVYLHSLIFY